MGSNKEKNRALSREDVRAIETVVSRDRRALVIPVRDGVVIKEVRETLVKPSGNSQTVGNLPDNP